MLRAEVGGDRLERGNAPIHPRPGSQVDVIGRDPGPVGGAVPQLGRESPTFVINEGVRDLEHIRAGEHGAQDRDIIIPRIVADERPTGTVDLVQDRRELDTIAIHAGVLAIVGQEATAPAAWWIDLDVEENTLREIEDVF